MRRPPSSAVDRLRHAAELAGVVLALALVRLLPHAVVRPLTCRLADLVFLLMGRRRRLAVENVRAALGDTPGGASPRAVARASVRSFALAAIPDVVALRQRLTGPGARDWLLRRSPELETLFDGARRLHDGSGGCIFVTPHLGSWEVLPYVASALGIPLAIAYRPLDNPWLEALLERAREETGQLFVSRRSALGMLDLQLARGRSVALLADQSTMGGLQVDFFGRPAATSPLPALLAVRHQRPLAVAACLRTGALRFTGFVSEPILPDPGAEDRSEVHRLTEAANRAMEAVIRAHPDQYLWMHDRWKVYDETPAVTGSYGAALP